MVEIINEQTGEVRNEKRPDVPFRSVTDLKDFNDNEVYEPNTSLTEPGQDVNIRVLAERCERGELVPLRSGYFVPDQYETLDEALDAAVSNDLDLADYTADQEVLRRIYAQKQKDLSTGKSEQAAGQQASEQGRLPVDKSETSEEVLA